MIPNEDVGKSFLLCMILSKVTSFKLDPFCSQACLTGRWGLRPSDSKPQGHLLQLVASRCVLQCTFWRRAECLPGEVRSQCLVSFLHCPLLLIFESESDFSWNLKLIDWAKLTGPWASRTCLPTPPPPCTATIPALPCLDFCVSSEPRSSLHQLTCLPSPSPVCLPTHSPIWNSVPHRVGGIRSTVHNRGQRHTGCCQQLLLTYARPPEESSPQTPWLEIN